MENRSFQEENLEIDSEILANALSECDVSNIENKLEFFRNFVLNQNKDFFRETGFPSKLENGQLNTEGMSFHLREKLKTSLTNHVVQNKENVSQKNDSVKAFRAKFQKRKKQIHQHIQKMLKDKK